MKIKFNLFVVTSFLLILQTASHLAQTRSCDVRVNVFQAHDSERPLDSPVKDSKVSIISLTNNQLFKSKVADGRPVFSNLVEGKYNIAVEKAGYSTVSKLLELNCRLVDEKNIFEEYIFMPQGGFSQSAEMYSFLLDNSPKIAIPDSLDGSKAENVPCFTEKVKFLNLNERAVFMPLPKSALPFEKFIDYQNQGKLSYSFKRVFVSVDEKGNVRKICDDVSDLAEISEFPEKVKLTKFIPFKVDGRPTAVSGYIIYQIKN